MIYITNNNFYDFKSRIKYLFFALYYHVIQVLTYVVFINSNTTWITFFIQKCFTLIVDKKYTDNSRVLRQQVSSAIIKMIKGHNEYFERFDKIVI